MTMQSTLPNARPARWHGIIGQLPFDRVTIASVGILAVVLASWEWILVPMSGISPALLPRPSQIAVALWRGLAEGDLLSDTLITLTEVVQGYLLGSAIGFLLAIPVAESRTAERILTPYIVAAQAIPKVAIAPLFVVWFGFGIIPKVLSAFLLGFFPVVVATVTGLKSVDPDMLDLARSMRAGRLKTFLYIALPHSLPHVFAGLKVSVTLAVVGAVVGEFVGSNSGIGYLLQIANGNFDLPLMFAALIVLSFIGVILFAAVDAVERWMLPWHASNRTTLHQATA